jgi:deoxycytidine triphosphate deaminase
MATTQTALPGSLFILRYEDIQSEINNGHLLANAVQESVQGASYDLRVGTVFREGQIVNDHHPRRGEQFIIEPSEIISLLTLEELNLPSDIVAVAFPMNRWSSEGLLILNPGYVDPGFKGPLSIKAVNLRKSKIDISLGQPIFTVAFFRIGAHTTHAYDRNVTRHQRETDVNKRELEQSAGSIAELLEYAKQHPYTTKHDVQDIGKQIFVTPDQVDRAIRDHWMNRWTFISAIVAALAAVIVLFRGH